MIVILVGGFGFASLFLSDLCQLRRRRLPSLVLWGSGYCSVGAAFFLQVISFRPTVPVGLLVLGSAAAGLFLLLLVYSVLIEIPLKAKAGRLITGGTYGLSRHPGLLWFILLHLALNASYRDWNFLLISAVMILLDLLLVLAEDIYLFPRMFKEYAEYKRRVPFLIPRLRRS